MTARYRESRSYIVNHLQLTETVNTTAVTSNVIKKKKTLEYMSECIVGVKLTTYDKQINGHTDDEKYVYGKQT